MGQISRRGHNNRKHLLIMYYFYLNTYNLTYSVQLENSTPPKTGTGYASDLQGEGKQTVKYTKTTTTER